VGPFPNLWRLKFRLILQSHSNVRMLAHTLSTLVSVRVLHIDICNRSLDEAFFAPLRGLLQLEELHLFLSYCVLKRPTALAMLKAVGQMPRLQILRITTFGSIKGHRLVREISDHVQAMRLPHCVVSVDGLRV
jgi:hypothetical protein